MATKAVARPGGLSWRSLLRGRRWIWTGAVLLLMALDVHLASWQFQRYQLRVAEQARLAQQVRRAPVTLPLADGRAALDSDLAYRRAYAQGTFDFSRQFMWVGARDRMEPGPHLVTPLRLASGRAVLVDRGWLPAMHDAPEKWRAFDAAASEPLTGLLLPGTPVADPAFLATQPRPVLFWSRMDIQAIQAQMPYELLPFYLHLEPTDAEASWPARTWYAVRTEPGMHLGYSAQWIMAALILGFFYVMIVRFIERRTGLRQAAAVAAAPLGSNAPKDASHG